MPAKKQTEKKLEDFSYDELEKEASLTLEKLNDDTLPLDEASKLYQYGKKLYDEMKGRLEKLEKEVSDTVDRS